LRLLKTKHGAAHGARAEIDHADRVIAELGDKEQLPREIDREMVDAAADGPEWDL
jgi:hypothetical protein